MEEQQYFQVPEESLELRKQVELYAVANDTLTKDYETVKKDLVFEKSKTSQLTREKGDLEKQLTDLLRHTQEKLEEVKNIIIEVPCRTLYGLAFDWQTPSDSVFVTIDPDGKVNLRTRQEVIEINRRAEDPDWKPVYRHWWNVKVADVISGGMV